MISILTRNLLSVHNKQWADHIAHLIVLQPQDLELSPWHVIPGEFPPSLPRLGLTHCKDLTNFSSMPSSPRNGIGDQINPPQLRATLAANSVSARTASARNIAYHIFLQGSSLNFFPDLGIAGQASRAPWWDEDDFTPQTQCDDMPTGATVGMSENILCVHFTTVVPLKREMLHRHNADSADARLSIQTHIT
jgi:hypothetical protein